VLEFANLFIFYGFGHFLPRSSFAVPSLGGFSGFFPPKGGTTNDIAIRLVFLVKAVEIPDGLSTIAFWAKSKELQRYFFSLRNSTPTGTFLHPWGMARNSVTILHSQNVPPRKSRFAT
jgi:hypothetical protein